MDLNLNDLIIKHDVSISKSYSIRKDKYIKIKDCNYYFKMMIKDSSFIDKESLLINGFIPSIDTYMTHNDDEVFWIPMRSTRIVISECSFEKNRFYNRFYNGGFSTELVSEENIKHHIADIYDVFKSYIIVKDLDPNDNYLNFDRLLNLKNLFLFVIYNKDKKPCAYNISFKYGNSLLVSHNIQNKNDEYRLGAMLRSEIRKWCKDNNILYYYLGEGYEDWGIYKANESTGFEWWTGKEWSRNKELYIDLCKKDTGEEI